MHTAQGVYMYAMVIILRSSAVASLPYFVFIVSECCSSVRVLMQSNIFKTVQWAHYLHSFLYAAWSRCKCTRNWEPNRYIYVSTTFFSFTILYFSIRHNSLRLALALTRKCCSFLCIVISSKPQPCFSHCDLVGDFLSLHSFTLQKHYMTSRINRILSLLP